MISRESETELIIRFNGIVENFKNLRGSMESCSRLGISKLGTNVVSHNSII